MTLKTDALLCVKMDLGFRVLRCIMPLTKQTVSQRDKEVRILNAESRRIACESMTAMLSRLAAYLDVARKTYVER